MAADTRDELPVWEYRKRSHEVAWDKAPSVEIVQALLESENEVDALRAEVRRLLTLGQGQRTLDLLARYEALLEEHADCLTVAHQQESELEQTEARVHYLAKDERHEYRS